MCIVLCSSTSRPTSWTETPSAVSPTPSKHGPAPSASFPITWSLSTRFARNFGTSTPVVSLTRVLNQSPTIMSRTFARRAPTARRVPRVELRHPMAEEAWLLQPLRVLPTRLHRQTPRLLQVMAPIRRHPRSRKRNCLVTSKKRVMHEERSASLIGCRMVDPSPRIPIRIREGWRALEVS